MSHDTFLNVSNWRWLRITTIVVLAAVLWYFVDDPLMPRSGSTLYGYTLGILCGIAMVFLLWYGVRKKRYFAESTTLKEMLSAHIWIGIGVLVLVPFHSGFQFHFNVHTMAYVVCVLTIVTGVWGVYVYRALPAQIKSNRGEGSLKNLIEQFDNLSAALRRLESGKSDAFITFVTRLDTYKVLGLPMLILGKRAQELSKEITAKELKLISHEERSDALAAISIIDKRFEFLVRIEKEALVQFWLKVWLYGHVPLACGSVLLLIIHIVSVLYYG